MHFMAWNRWRKRVKHTRHAARQIRALREDVAPPDALENLRAAEAALDAAWRRRDETALDAACAAVEQALPAVRPPRPLAGLRENVEVIVVALAVAMAFRCYFVQPFKIPTGSMQPTLYGVITDPDPVPDWTDRIPFRWARWALFGEGLIEVRARNAGPVTFSGARWDEGPLLFVGDRPHKVRDHMRIQVRPGDWVRRGDRLASGRVRLGDHIFVNKLRYNVTRPSRGDIVVFETREVDHPQIQRDTFYIKRLAGLPGERVALDPPYLVADGRRITEPFPFRRLLADETAGYHGYIFAQPDPRQRPVLLTADDEVRLAPDRFLPLGDNTRSSLDGRYFGGVPRRSLVGPAAVVYWPLSARWGRVR